jgi:glyceraldehyde-3-phosphate dehydrogenase (NAD(P))
VNYDKAIGAKSVRIVSCNTTGLVRIIRAISNHHRVERVRAYIVRRATDPKEIDRGPINAIVLDPPKIPSHHADDVRSVLGDRVGRHRYSHNGCRRLHNLCMCT